MIAALERLKAAHEEPELPDQLAAFGVSGKTTGGFASLFRSHPPLDERIQTLQKGPEYRT
jgi:heat shock protein HtpX